ncbi:MAG: outer membrane lipoprotein-sorting protein [Methylococcaceae bacterium]|nr:outer membrane lipoprotein-sorting protein [Methylococcaceae bacterium]
MKKAIFLTFFYFITQPAFGENTLTAEDILSKVDEVRSPGNDFSFDLEVEQGAGEDKKNYSFSVKVKDKEKSLVTYTAPLTSKGRRILMVGENLWIYVPKTRMPIRISAQQKVSSGVSNADVARVVYSLDYEATKLEIEKNDDKEDLYHLFLTAKTKAAAYQDIEIWVDSKVIRPLRANFYTKTGKKLKTIVYKDYQQVLNKQRPMLLEVIDYLNNGQKILMKYSNMALTETPDIYFQKSYLSRIK